MTSPSVLTRRQRQFCDLLVAGLDVRSAAAKHGITYASARTLVRDCNIAYGVHSVRELVEVHSGGTATYQAPKRGRPRCEGLTPGELAIFELAATGLSWTEIGALNKRSMNTIRRQTHNAYRKLGVRSRHAALIKLGLLKSARVFAVQELSEPFAEVAE